MRVLILSQFYKPEPVFKPHELAEGLQERGHQVTVLTGFPNYPYGTLYEGYRLRPWHVETVSGVRVIRLHLYPDHSRSPVRRILNYSSFCMSASILGPILCGPVDVMYVRHPPLTVGVAAWILSLARHIPFIYAVHDLWPESIVAAGMLTNRRLISLLERMECFIYRRADAIGVASPGFIGHLQRKGVPRGKIQLLTDWADEQVYRPVSPDPSLAEELGMAGRFNVVFGGQLGIAQGLDTLIDAWEFLRPHENIQLVIVGDGVEKRRLEAVVAVRGLRNVRFLGRLPSDKMPTIYAMADVLLVHLIANPIFRMSVPGKTYAYMGCGKPLLMAVDGVAAEMIRSANAGLTCPSEDPQAIARAVLQFFHLPQKMREAMGANAREAFLKQYSQSVVLEKHERLLASLCR